MVKLDSANHLLGTFEDLRTPLGVNFDYLNYGSTARHAQSPEEHAAIAVRKDLEQQSVDALPWAPISCLPSGQGRSRASTLSPS